MQKKVNLADAKSTPQAEEWDNMTVDELKTRTLWTQGKKQLHEGVWFDLVCWFPKTWLRTSYFRYFLSSKVCVFVPMY